MSQHTVLKKALAQCIAERLTFAAFRTPGQPVQIWAQRTPDLETVDGTLLLELNQVFLIAPFNLDREHVPFIRADIELMFPEIDPDISRLGECEGSPVPPQTPAPATAKADFIQAVAAAKQACTSRGIDKVVLSRVMDAELEADLLPELFTRAMEASGETFVAMACTPEHGLWMGASPERLVHEEEDHVRVDAIAATRPSDKVPERISAWGAKELDEQDQVTRHVHRAFVRKDVGNIVVHGPEVIQAGPVAHLRTVLEGDLGETLLGDLVLELHPTPAVCGAPTEAARAFIGEHERHDRLLYAGFWGPWNAEGPTELFVNLRCMQVRSGKVQLHLGAGITAGSDPEMEWTETVRKADTWLRLLEPTRAAT
ncbi:MAG: chorismate-binding protein [Flavobacteriales bacterium]|jgi:isochorismate synthase|nr:chorismate-binding protein [Flavobacteriales bacterium]MBK9600025.1 chorismate-binding protein [Flavobacteriales bacterium]